MRRRSLARAVGGIIVLVLACGVALLSHGVAEATQNFRWLQADWQRGLAARPSQPAGATQRLAEKLLGIQARREVMAAYLDYRFGLGSVVPGAVFPQTEARWNAVATIGRLRHSLTSARDRAGVDVTLGVIDAASAEAAGSGGQQRALRRNAVDAFRRGVLEDPTSTDAKHDLEVLLARAAKQRARAQSRSRGQRDQQGNPTTPRTQPEGTGY